VGRLDDVVVGTIPGHPVISARFVAVSATNRAVIADEI
jgi:hypothetical protein